MVEGRRIMQRQLTTPPIAWSRTQPTRKVPLRMAITSDSSYSTMTLVSTGPPVFLPPCGAAWKSSRSWEKNRARVPGRG